MIDISKMLGIDKQVFADVPKFCAAWLEFMNKLNVKLDTLLHRVDAVDSRVQTLIDIAVDGHPPTVTPEVLAFSLQAANEDPRNSTLATEASFNPPRLGAFDDPQYLASIRKEPRAN